MKRVYRVADLFCGAGGSSTGAIRAIRSLGGDVELVAVNHWDVAIATHSRNHPGARHYCVNLDAARPEELVPDGRLDLLMASPECVFFSRARGGKPVSDQRRMSAWHVQRWCSALDVTCLLIENVPEFRDWGPLLPDGHPDPAAKGLYFQAWVQALWGMGYTVDWRLLNAANFGDATTRIRFFLQARKDGKAIRWPEPSHAPEGSGEMFGGRPRWRAAREVIDWGNPGGSLLSRKRPLSLKTRLRIARGLQRFGGVLAPLYIRLLDLPEEEAASFVGPKPEPAKGAGAFVLSRFGNDTSRSTEEPLPTVVGRGAGYLVEPTAEPFVCGNRENNVPKGMDEPLPTATTAAGGGMFLVEPKAEPFVLGQQSGSAPRSTDKPLPTIATGGNISLIQPMLTSYYGGSEGAQSVEEPVPTITTKARHGLCCPTMEPFIFGKQSNPSYRPLTEPLPTITAMGASYLVSPFIVPQFGEAEGQAPRVHDIADPLPAVTSHGAGALVEPMVLQMAQVGRSDNGMARSMEDPLYTITTHKNLAAAFPTLTEAVGEVDPDRLVLIDGVPYLLDIRFRMLNNRELARAMGFDDGEQQYQFSGTVGEITRQIGNAVPVHLAEALVLAELGELPAARSEVTA